MRTAVVVMLASYFAVAPTILDRSVYARSSQTDDNKEDKVATELKRWAGRWEIDNATFEGRQLKIDKGVMREVRGWRMRLYHPEKPEFKVYYAITLDPSVEPKRVTLTEARVKLGVLVPVTNGLVARCVYKFTGDKLITAQWRGEGAVFPQSLEPSADNPVMVLTLKRVRV